MLQGLEKVLEAREKEFEGAPLGRLFYLALPPSVYPQVRVLLTGRRSLSFRTAGCWSAACPPLSESVPTLQPM